MRSPATRKAVRWTPEQGAKVQARLAAARGDDVLEIPSFLRTCQDAAGAVKKRPKYAAHPVVLDGIRFDSRLECARYVQLMQLRAAGEVEWFTRQVPFYLPGGGKIVVDFLVRWKDGSNTVEDCKGYITDAWKAKRRVAEAVHRIQIKVLRRGDF